jgi:hypothetical protein
VSPTSSVQSGLSATPTTVTVTAGKKVAGVSETYEQTYKVNLIYKDGIGAPLASGGHVNFIPAETPADYEFYEIHVFNTAGEQSLTSIVLLLVRN